MVGAAGGAKPQHHRHKSQLGTAEPSLCGYPECHSAVTVFTAISAPAGHIKGTELR